MSNINIETNTGQATFEPTVIESDQYDKSIQYPISVDYDEATSWPKE